MDDSDSRTEMAPIGRINSSSVFQMSQYPVYRYQLSVICTVLIRAT